MPNQHLREDRLPNYTGEERLFSQSISSRPDVRQSGRFH